ncbi:DUF2141 domain-containing protein [Lyngbya confervoides]|uniref:DUF2141 domain-containing protein n=1 Tax=Lyngbya confervoides BDU141951 TaxID=1574623 RepID=A0ABD4T0G1_9CYAN|nr:DUF2141 domain-containing protein [Lyngbya confervoides]MCM1982009.1 DUF2141 domain-containing protein [Lyngbya confervoides BDU141951]
MKRVGFLLLGAACIAVLKAPMQAAYGGSNRLTVQVQGLKASQGRMCYSLFSSSQGFPNHAESAIRATCLPVNTNNSAIAFGNLNPGTYAVAVFHDRNGDGQLNKNQFGIPTEGFGFSQNPVIVSGPPSFRDAAFLVAGPRNAIQIQLKHLL